jgi:hypothetical protein
MRTRHVLASKINEAEAQILYWTEMLQYGSQSREQIDFWTGRLSGLRSAQELIA